MNAYEIADELDGRLDHKAANMLRQQADRIAELEKEADRLSNHADELRKVHADRIAELEKELKRTKFAWNLAENEIENKDRRIKDLTIKLNTKAIKVAELEKSAEPVAWIKKDTLIFLGNYEFGSITVQVQKQKDDEFDIPLYTTPQIKELSDEEIEQIASQYLSAHAQFIGAGEVCYEGEIEFARAILKKASEK